MFEYEVYKALFSFLYMIFLVSSRIEFGLLVHGVQRPGGAFRMTDRQETLTQMIR